MILGLSEGTLSGAGPGAGRSRTGAPRLGPAGAVGSKLDESWGLNRGTWSVLRHAYPEADVPVVQLSIDETKPPAFHFEIGKKLAPLREEGVLIAGSGNLVQTLHAYAWGRHMPDPFAWAVRFLANGDMYATGCEGRSRL